MLKTRHILGISNVLCAKGERQLYTIPILFFSAFFAPNKERGKEQEWFCLLYLILYYLFLP
jgi:hypothetical protein